MPMDSRSPESQIAQLRSTLRIRHLDSRLFIGLRSTAPVLTMQITERIQKEVASYAGPASGRRHALIATAVRHAIDQFCAALENRPHSTDDVVKLFRQMGRGEAQDGNTLDAMRAAYLIATHEAWSHLRRHAATNTMPPEALASITQALFIYIDRLTRLVAAGHLAGSEQRASQEATSVRQKLVERLLDGRSTETVADLAERADWAVPAQLIVFRAELDISRRPRNLATHLAVTIPHILIRDEIHSITAILAGNSDSSLPYELRHLPSSQHMAYSWPVPVDHTRHALLWVRRALRLMSSGVIHDQAIVNCGDYRTLLWMHADPVLMRHTRDELLAPLAQEKPHSKAVLSETLLLWLQTHASAPKLAEQLGVHDQTIRMRLRRLKELFGDQLIDPSQSLALLIALRQVDPSHPEPK